MAAAASRFTPLVCVVDFQHARGPEIEHWIGIEPGSDPVAENDWGLIPYMALPDGAHQSDEEFSYFSLIRKGAASGASVEPSSVFGISCMHQIPADQLLWKSEDVTRSAVQKAVVAITDRPQGFAALREKLSFVTKAWFAQRDFRELEILQHFQESLARESASSEDEQDQSFGLGLRQLIHQFKWQTLVLFKCLLLQPKMLFFGSHCERVCQIQFSLISLIPNLVRNLRDCADPSMDRYAETIQKSDSVRTSDRASLLAYMGLPLQLFGKGGVFGPYTPLQQLDMLTDRDTKSYVVGSTNGLLIRNKTRYCDVLIDLDESSVSISSPALKAATTLSTADRRWIDFLTQVVNDTWDESDPSRPKTHGYAGSEEHIRMQFDEYLLALLAATKYRQYIDNQKLGTHASLIADIEGDPSVDFYPPFLDAWRETENYKLWNRITDSHIFDINEPRHPCAGGLTIEDVQRRLASQVAELHLDERFNQTREVVGKRLTDGRNNVTSAFSKVWADIEVMREAQRKRSEEARAAAEATASSEPSPPQGTVASRISKPDLTQAQASVAAAGQRAGAYFSSWGAWASEKRKSGWRTSTAVESSQPKTTTVAELDEGDVHDEITGPEVEAWVDVDEHKSPAGIEAKASEAKASEAKAGDTKASEMKASEGIEKGEDEIKGSAAKEEGTD